MDRVKYEPNQTIDAAAPLETIPLFVKAGSIVPMGPFIQYAEEKTTGVIELRVYPGANGSFSLYEDENDNFNYEKGKYAIIPFSWNDKTKTLTIGKRQGKLNGMLQKRIINVVLVNQSAGTGLEISKSYKTIHYSGKIITIGMN